MFNARYAFSVHKNCTVCDIDNTQLRSATNIGMDIPVMAGQTNDDASLTQQIIGVKVHGIRNYCFIVDGTIPGSVNLMCEVFYRFLIPLDKRNELPTVQPTLSDLVLTSGQLWQE